MGPSPVMASVLTLMAIMIAAFAEAATPSGVWISCLLGWWLLALATIDYRLFILPDALTLSLAVCGIAVTAVESPARIPDSLVGAAAGFTVLAALRYAYLRLRGRDGLGLGDAKLLAALGAWLGWRALPEVILVAAIGGLLTILAVRLLGRSVGRDQPIPFGPFLAVGGWMAWLLGDITLG